MAEKRQYQYASSKIALRELKEKGYTLDYNLKSDDLLNNPEDFEIIYIYRYEGDSNPDDESSVYGIRRLSTHEQGFFVVGNLAYAEDGIAEILINLEIKRK